MTAASDEGGRGWRWPRWGDAAVVEANGRCTSRLGKNHFALLWSSCPTCRGNDSF
jgi:hypothetical protein